MRCDREIHVVVVGSTNFDLVVKAERLPKEGESMMVKDVQFFPGGKGANQAVAVARMGAKASFLSCVGQDIIGDFLIRDLESSGIDTAWVKRTAQRSTGCAFIMLFPNGNNCITVDPAANLALTPVDVERAREVIERADAVVSVLEIPLEVVEAAFRVARKAGRLTVLDAGPPRYCPSEILRLADIVSPNETELAQLTGADVSGRVSAREAAEKLLAQGVGTVVLKLGSDGAMLVTPQGAEHFPAYKINALDPTAAGDAFTAAFTVEYAAGTKIEDAIRFANGAGALAATKLGAQSSLPTRQEVEAFVARQGQRSR
ncbi:MAG: ribokinase [Terriglobia bacterium]|jgi:ribokinase